MLPRIKKITTSFPIPSPVFCQRRVTNELFDCKEFSPLKNFALFKQVTYTVRACLSTRSVGFLVNCLGSSNVLPLNLFASARTMKHLGAVMLKHRQPLCRMSIQEYRVSGQPFRSVVFPARRLKTL